MYSVTYLIVVDFKNGILNHKAIVQCKPKFHGWNLRQFDRTKIGFLKSAIEQHDRKNFYFLPNYEGNILLEEEKIHVTTWPCNNTAKNIHQS